MPELLKKEIFHNQLTFTNFLSTLYRAIENIVYTQILE